MPLFSVYQVTYCLTDTVYVIVLLIVLLGRVLLSLFGILSAPEIYTAAIGFYLIWAMIRCGTTIFKYASAGVKSFLSETLKWTVIVCISNDCGIELCKICDCGIEFI